MNSENSEFPKKNVSQLLKDNQYSEENEKIDKSSTNRSLSSPDELLANKEILKKALITQSALSLRFDQNSLQTIFLLR